MNTRIEKLYDWVDYIYPLYFIVSFLSFRFGIWSLTTYYKLFVILFSFYVVHKTGLPNKNRILQVFKCYFIYVVLSVIAYLVNEVPFSAYLNELYNSIPVMLFVFIGMNDPRHGRSYYSKYLIACSIAMFVGVVLFYTNPSWYISGQMHFMNDTWHATVEYSEGAMLERLRFNCFMGSSYVAQMLSISGLTMALYYYYINPNMLRLSSVVLLFFTSLLTMQRVAIFCSIAIVISFVIYAGSARKIKANNRMILTIAIFLSIESIFMFQMDDRWTQIFDSFTNRFDEMSVSGAMKERNYQWTLLTEHWRNPLTGHGMGAGGPIARMHGLPGVSDCSYIEWLYDLGLIGFVMFAIIVIRTLLRCKSYFRAYAIEAVIITFVLVAMIGSNTLTIGYFSILPFWYAIGKVWNPYYYSYFTNKQIETL